MGAIRIFPKLMGAIASIKFEKGLIEPINFLWKQGSKGNLQPCIEIINGLLGILHPSIEIPYDTPENLLESGFSRISYRCQKSSCSIPFDAKRDNACFKKLAKLFQYLLLKVHTQLLVK